MGRSSATPGVVAQNGAQKKVILSAKPKFAQKKVVLSATPKCTQLIQVRDEDEIVMKWNEDGTIRRSRSLHSHHHHHYPRPRPIKKKMHPSHSLLKSI